MTVRTILLVSLGLALLAGLYTLPAQPTAAPDPFPVQEPTRMLGGAGSFVQATTSFASSGTTASATFLSPPTEGNLIVACVWNANATGITVLDGWTSLTQVKGGSGATSRAHVMFYKIAGAGESATVSATVNSSAWTIAAAEYSGIDTVTPVNVQDAKLNASGANNYVTPIVTATSSVDVLAVTCLGMRSNVTFSNQKFNNSTTDVNVRATRSQINASMNLFDRFVDNVSGNWQGMATSSANEVGAGSIVLFNQSSGVPPAPATSIAPVRVNGLINVNGIINISN
jgi:hypothetical protein